MSTVPQIPVTAPAAYAALCAQGIGLRVDPDGTLRALHCPHGYHATMAQLIKAHLPLMLVYGAVNTVTPIVVRAGCNDWTEEQWETVLEEDETVRNATLAMNEVTATTPVPQVRAACGAYVAAWQQWAGSRKARQGEAG